MFFLRTQHWHPFHLFKVTKKVYFVVLVSKEHHSARYWRFPCHWKQIRVHPLFHKTAVHCHPQIQFQWELKGTIIGNAPFIRCHMLRSTRINPPFCVSRDWVSGFKNYFGFFSVSWVIADKISCMLLFLFQISFLFNSHAQNFS